MTETSHFQARVLARVQIPSALPRSLKFSVSSDDTSEAAGFGCGLRCSWISSIVGHRRTTPPCDGMPYNSTSRTYPQPWERRPLPPRREMRTMSDAEPYAAPTPKVLYIHDDLSDYVSRQHGQASPAWHLTRE